MCINNDNNDIIIIVVDGQRRQSRILQLFLFFSLHIYSRLSVVARLNRGAIV